MELRSILPACPATHRSISESPSPVSIAAGFAPGMTQQRARQRRTRELLLEVSGLEVLAVEIPVWERELIKPALLMLLDRAQVPEVEDAPAR